MRFPAPPQAICLNRVDFRPSKTSLWWVRMRNRVGLNYISTSSRGRGKECFEGVREKGKRASLLSTNGLTVWELSMFFQSQGKEVVLPLGAAYEDGRKWTAAVVSSHGVPSHASHAPHLLLSPVLEALSSWSRCPDLILLLLSHFLPGPRHLTVKEEVLRGCVSNAKAARALQDLDINDNADQRHYYISHTKIHEGYFKSISCPPSVFCSSSTSYSFRVLNSTCHTPVVYPTTHHFLPLCCSTSPYYSRQPDVQVDAILVHRRSDRPSGLHCLDS